MIPNSLAILLWVFFVHLAGIYLFTSGFLLTRLALTETTTCTECTLAPTHTRAVVLIIDALRFDFLSPNPPIPVSPFHHNILSLPQQLTASRPAHSFLFNAYSDPPTTTLQRIKGLTTGSLPTFVDLGNNFGASSIAEDSIMNQLQLAGKSAAFMGDDTWISVFPDSFGPNMSFPYDSFNVEDLHTVDEGVITHLFPLLEDQSKPFDFLIGHFLGVDHVGHRVGPDHPGMKAKLEQMNDVLKRVVELLDDNTLLVVLGDHGMDRSGDHGGDGSLETSSALWIYSKGPQLSRELSSLPSGVLQYSTFPGAPLPHRSVQQIDLLPTLSLLLGLPIPFNNLGSVIPELFWRNDKGTDFSQALQLNAAQIYRYLEAYRSSASGGELDDYWDELELAWHATQNPELRGDFRLITLANYNRVALSTCRALWAQFNPLRMAFGLAVLAVGFIASWTMYSGLREARYEWGKWSAPRVSKSLRGMSGGAVLGLVLSLGLRKYLQGIDSLDCILFAAPLLSSMLIIISFPPKISTLKSIPIPLVLHTITFFSNSFTFWEDRVILYLCLTSIVPFVFTGITAATSRLRYRILGFSFLYAVCVRLMAISTICREEQQPYCHVTFYSSSTLPTPPVPILVLAVPVAVGIPYILQRFLHVSRSDVGLAHFFIPIVLIPALLAGTGYWILEWLDSTGYLGDAWTTTLRISRTYLARGSFALILLVGGLLWWFFTLCIDVSITEEPNKKLRKVEVIGFANAFGAPYLLFWSIFFVLVYTSSQLTSQVVLGLGAVALLAFLEVVDSARDARYYEEAFASSNPSVILQPTKDQSPMIRFADILPIALLGLHTFFATGHQSTISSIQWKSAFLLTPSVTYPFAPITVVLNSFGPVFLAGIAVPLLALWNRPPLFISSADEQPRIDVKVRGESVMAALGMMMYYASLLLGTAVSAAVLRRHLMVWKVFAPRFMAGVLGVLVVDVAVLIGVGIGLERIRWKLKPLSGMFRGASKQD
ncbi:uncharacterized protein BT62DRAFT_959308 [Guyanagaster necrorhizus]|uniref:GPI ethanolamine phosphate transferase 2 C-terminal domain-containing protein n=1 Tax=Guyanagaster necrorhizus TaxID=856835 RepID=A0A9P7W6K2_9AGAR|nr:uncharacterized protein BT62DRAFT_959308 [Guyanagaster necrorhizus MCA 3950]KAG7453068.1 hypothetical protein BT62DRAFT_959308 [Guyanagaster necrorhizus MCA 3950]